LTAREKPDKLTATAEATAEAVHTPAVWGQAAGARRSRFPTPPPSGLANPNSWFL